MADLITAVASWQSLALALLVFGFAPGVVLRLLVKLYPKHDPRRVELLAELYQLGRVERLLFVAEQLETVLFEGLPHRIREIRRSTRQEGSETEPHTEVTARARITHRGRVSCWNDTSHTLETDLYGNLNCHECSNA